MAASSEGDKGGDAFDVVLVHGATGDGEGARVLRVRPGHLEAGEVRPLRDGQPIAAGGEVVRLVERPDARCAYDVKVDYKAPAATPPTPPGLPARNAHGPAQVATSAYRDSWDRTFALPAARRPN
ncbi:MAG TPA: hypothetical protein VH044_00530 [Polyangiaceae bacterium]|jgi:hypothetical protein|nr:hypothetical protein [Polyangiaceae bacterium]